MKFIYSIFTFFLLPFFIACDDGDVIVDQGFEFNPGDLELCNTGSLEPNNEQSNAAENNAVFFNINSSTNEVIAFQLNNRFFDATNVSDAGSEIVSVENVNLVFLDFDASITSDYFCSGIPDTSINIISELRGDRGNIEITTQNITRPDGDDDSDGISNEDEFFENSGTTLRELLDGSVLVGRDLTIFRDSDGDGIPDFRDSDDDNDNVRTALELNQDDIATEENEGNTPMDTDGDGIPNHLDTDDDGDGVLTRNEITETAIFPTDGENRNEDNLPNYLNAGITTSFEATELLLNRFTNSFRTTVLGRSVGLREGEQTISREFLPFGELNASAVEEDTVRIPMPEVGEIAPTETPPTTTTM